MREIALLGPTGNIGSALARLLMKNGQSFRTGNRQDFDYYKPETYLPFLRGATDLFLVIPLIESMEEVTRSLVTAAKQAGIQRIVKISALGADPKSEARILRWHGATEKIIQQSKIPSISIRPNAFMQNFIQFYGKTIKDASLIAVPAGEAKVSFIDTEDIARIVYRAFESFDYLPQIIDLTGPKALSFLDVALLLGHALGKPIQYINIPEAVLKEKMLGFKVPEWQIDALLELYATYRQGAAEQVNSNFEKITGTLATSIENFIQRNRMHWGKEEKWDITMKSKQITEADLQEKGV